MVNKTKELKAALRKAILSISRAKSRCVEVDPAGNSYEVDWLDEVKGWAKLCNLNLKKYDPTHYWGR